MKLGVTGIAIGLLAKNIKRDYLTRALNLIKRYGIKTSFKTTLGIQAEIQKELEHLINAWINREKTFALRKKENSYLWEVVVKKTCKGNSIR